jgi:MFS transporter, DHA2 family, multidrug resistance protein
MGSARPERAGAVSALAQTGAELGGALGIAMPGSLGTAMYRATVMSAIPNGIAPALSAAARDTLGDALSVASQLSDPIAAATLASTAQQGLTSAVQVTSAISAAISTATAIAALVYLRAPRDECEHSPAATSEREPCVAA